MKKTVKLFLILTLCLTLCTALVACGDNGGSNDGGSGDGGLEGHTHVAKDAVKENVVDATCTIRGFYDEVVYCKECNAEMSRSKKTAPLLEHNYINGSCNFCGAKQPSEGLEYTLKSDDTYEVSAIGTCTDTDIVIPATYNNKAVTSIGRDAFFDCEAILSVTIPNGVTSIGNCAFANCSLLASVIISDSVTFIGEEAFSDCEALISVTIGRGLATMGEDLFEECEALTTINYNGTKEEWKAISKDVYWKEDTGEFTVYCSNGNLTKEEA